MCKLGGMLANNSSGPHTLRYGAVKDNVLSMRVCLESGGWLTAGVLQKESHECRQVFDLFAGLETVVNLIDEHRYLIQSKRPRVSKNSAGYNVFDVVTGLENGVIDFPKLFVGSEGTLGIFSEATIQLVDRPLATVTGMIHFYHLEEMGESVSHLLKLDPLALEVMDGNTLDLIGRKQYHIPDDCVVIFDSDSIWPKVGVFRYNNICSSKGVF